MSTACANGIELSNMSIGRTTTSSWRWCCCCCVRGERAATYADSCIDCCGAALSLPTGAVEHTNNRTSVVRHCQCVLERRVIQTPSHRTQDVRFAAVCRRFQRQPATKQPANTTSAATTPPTITPIDGPLLLELLLYWRSICAIASSNDLLTLYSGLVVPLAVDDVPSDGSHARTQMHVPVPKQNVERRVDWRHA